MAIAAVPSQAGGAAGNNATLVSKAFTVNVTAGTMISIEGGKFSPSSDAFTAGDCTKIAGTATIGAFSLDGSHNIDMGSSDGFAAAGIWSALVTGSGSLTVQIGGGVAGSYFIEAVNEYTGSWDASRVEATNSAGSATNSQTAFSSGNVSTAGPALLVGMFQFNSNQAQTNTPDAAFTEIYANESGTDDNGCAAYRIVSSATTDAFDGTMTNTGLGSAGWCAVIVAYKEAAGGGSSRAARALNQYRQRRA